MKRISLFLAAVMLLSALASCANDNPSADTGKDSAADTTTAPVSESTTPAEDDPRQQLADNIPDADFDGANFTFLVSGEHYVVEDYSGESVNDTKYDRNKEIEARFGVKITENNQTWDRPAITAYINAAIAGGDVDSFDVVSINMVFNGGLAVSGNYRNWYDVPYINFDQPWWPTANIDCLTVNNRAFTIISDAAINSIGSTYCVFYDKVVAEDYSIPNMYELVRNGEWTYDKLLELTGNIYTDLNNDSARDKGDFYGFASGTKSNVNAYLWAFDNPIYVRNQNGEYEYTYYTDKLPNIIEKIVTMFSGQYQGVFGETNAHNTGVELFSEGRALFANGFLSHAISSFGDLENEYGIIPYPKYDEEQKEYWTMVDGGADSCGLSKIAPDLKLVGSVMEALAAETYKEVLPVYLDQTLKMRYSSSPEDAEMVDLVLASRYLDFGYVYDNWNGVGLILEEMVRDQSTNIASLLGKKSPAAQKYYKKVFAIFYE